MLLLSFVRARAAAGEWIADMPHWDGRPASRCTAAPRHAGYDEMMTKARSGSREAED